MRESSMRTNQELQHDVQAALEWEPSVDASGVGVAAEDGVVTISGRVGNYPEKWTVERVAKHVYGVKAVANELTVRLAGSAERIDSDIARVVANSLEWDVAVPEDRIKVAVSAGWVTLEGEVDWQYQKLAAEHAIHKLVGVKEVVSLITVKPKAEVSAIKAMIEAAFERSAEIDSGRVHVATHGRVVTLSGEIHSWSESEAAEQAVWAAPGVSKVVNHLTIAL
jgi:osmotically-inducible protein OsmY